jgi:alanine racemase
MRNSLLLIHIDNFIHNFGQIRQFVGPRVKISAAVKADAYGHGAGVIAAAAEKAGADFLGVAAPGEGDELRRAGISLPILLYGLCLPGETDCLISRDISAAVADGEGIAWFESRAAALGKKARLHLKIDTGMGRMGCAPSETLALARRIARSRNLVLEGICTHFPASDEKDRVYTENQIALFRSLTEDIRRDGIDPGIVHAANSGGVLQYPEAFFSMVRPGILLYGYYPSGETARPFPVKPVMELKSWVLFLKKVPPGTYISYGCTYKTERETWIATIGTGYADGYPRLLSNKGRVLINGKTYPVAGRISMDQTMVDLGPETEVKRYDEATLFGPDPSGPGADEIAGQTGTIPYEITCGINRRVPRIILEK